MLVICFRRWGLMLTEGQEPEEVRRRCTEKTGKLKQSTKMDDWKDRNLGTFSV